MKGRTARGGLHRLAAPLGRLVEVILPARCHLCGTFLGGGKKSEDEKDRAISPVLFCSACLAALKPPPGPACLICGDKFASPLGLDRICGPCTAKKPPFASARWTAPYQGALARAVRELKYGRRVELARPLGLFMASAEVTPPWPEGGRFDLVLPVPLHPSRLRSRGFNQAWLLAKNLDRLGRPRSDLLIRTRATASQVGLTKPQRRENVRAAFGAPRPEAIKGGRILLVDDVYTTGATVAECARTLIRAGAGGVDVLTLARLL